MGRGWGQGQGRTVPLSPSQARARDMGRAGVGICAWQHTPIRSEVISCTPLDSSPTTPFRGRELCGVATGRGRSGGESCVGWQQAGAGQGVRAVWGGNKGRDR